MNSAGNLLLIIWASYIIVTNNFADGIGIAWGRQSSQKLLPSAVVDMLLSNGIEKVKLFSYNTGVLRAFSKSNISITISLSNVEVGNIHSPKLARDWVQENITNFCGKYHVNISHFLIGHEPFTKVDNRTSYVKDEYGNTTYTMDIIPSLIYTQEAISEANIQNMTKVTTSHSTNILKPNIKKPSDGDFHDDVKQDILKILQLLDSQDAPFHVNMYPLNTIKEKGHPLEFAFFEEDHDYNITDGDNIYTNVFDEIYDTFVWALRKNGFPKMRITVGQVGWPTDGDIYANLTTSLRFHQGLLNRMRKNIGTPLQKGPLDVYIYGIADENMRSIEYRGPSARYYGIYQSDGTPKFDLDISGVEGEKRKLVAAQGVEMMPRRWCVLDPDEIVDPKDESVREIFEYVCEQADCSSLSYGSSCHGVLDYRGNISYAFNAFYQTYNQNSLGFACNFMGLGIVVAEDPSPKNGSCRFPLQIISTVFLSGQQEMETTLASAGDKDYFVFGLVIIGLPSLFMLLILFLYLNLK